MNNLILIDGPNLVYRAHYAFKDLSYRGHSTSVLYGFFNMLANVCALIPEANVIICWDDANYRRANKFRVNGGQRNTWRKQIYPDYKKNRKSVPDEIRRQLPIVVETLEALKFLNLGVDGLEADDLIGLFAEKLKHRERIFLFSTDKDLYQLLGDNVMMISAGQDNKILSSADIEELYGVSVRDWVKYKALVGDPSDGYKAVPNCGPVRAKYLLSQGVDPSMPRYSSNWQGLGVEGVWSEVHRCYRLARIPRDVEDPEFDRDLRKSVSWCYSMLSNRSRRVRTNKGFEQVKETFRQFCVQYGMADLWRNRGRFLGSLEVVEE